MTNFQLSINNIFSRNNLLIYLLLTLSIGERVLFDMGPNIEFITFSMLLAAVYLGRGKAFWIVLISMVISDAILGNTNIFIFTWSGFLIPAFFASIHLNKSKLSSIKLVGKTTVFGAGSTLFFFLWTNFGVWLLDSWGMYSNDLTGLTQSYLMALPFLKNHFYSNLIIIPLGILLIETSIKLNKVTSSRSALSLQSQN